MNVNDNGRFGYREAAVLSQAVRDHLVETMVDEKRLYDKARDRFEQRARDCGCL